MSEKLWLAGTAESRLQEYFLAQGEPKFRARQVAEWVYQKLVISPAEMSNLPEKIRAKLTADFYAPAARIREQVASGDGVTKLALELFDGETIETVVIPTPERLTFCLSTQVGCPVGCRFCASGAGGLKRNLYCGEILEQFLLGSAVAGRKPDNLVFMGIGEGLLNFSELSAALSCLTDPAGFAMSPRRITVSTSGYLPGMKKLIDLGKEYNLAVSLHAVDDATRAKLIPDALRYPIAEILTLADEYCDRIGRQYTIEYTLVAGINDSLDAAAALGNLAREHRAKINLIPLNRTNEQYRRPAPRVIQAFERAVAATGARVTRRVERGEAGSAACGQLRARIREKMTKETA